MFRNLHESINLVKVHVREHSSGKGCEFHLPGRIRLPIEIVDLDRPPAADTVEDTLARDIFQRHVILGAKDASRAGCNLAGL